MVPIWRRLENSKKASFLLRNTCLEFFVRILESRRAFRPQAPSTRLVLRSSPGVAGRSLQPVQVNCKGQATAPRIFPSFGPSRCQYRVKRQRRQARVERRSSWRPRGTAREYSIETLERLSWLPKGPRRWWRTGEGRAESLLRVMNQSPPLCSVLKDLHMTDIQVKR